MVIFAGDLSSVRAAVDNCKTNYPKRLIDSFVLGNPHKDLLPAICGATEVSEVEALGASTQNAAMFVLLDTYDALIKAKGEDSSKQKDKDKDKSKSKFDVLLTDKTQVSLF